MINRLTRVFKDELISKLLKNAGTLLSGNIIASVMGLLTLIITARTLGPEAFGILVLIQTYILVVDGLMNFQSWQAMIKFGTDFNENQEVDLFKAMIKYVLLIDVLTAIIATILAITMIKVIGPFINIDENVYHYVMLFSFVILFHVSGVPIAILRMFNKFKLLAFQAVLTSLIKLIGVIILFITESELLGFVIVWVITDIAGHILLQYLGFRELKKRNLSNILDIRINLLKGYIKNIWTFIITTNLNSSIRMSTRQLDILIVGSILGNHAVGLYKVAKQFSSVLSRLADPLYKAIYPQLTKLYTQKKLLDFKNLIIQSSALVFIPVMILWVVFFCLVILLLNIQ
ncbi:oligosaccharide flippase family protein [Heliorestis convoluta]|uniref:Oligosaccharide flippase family protein n=1 Tax=Heliorestis convoluta TaxID=356322 RepID=A0A5Q2N0J6_9FIRM|nr:oligosaccharide flippase family protein [Heliorestis convoluta]QGG47309.1 oligosaccharide flippase family protein [Heliorestis convoluta]